MFSPGFSLSSNSHRPFRPLAAFCLDAEQPDYDLDTDDETFVNKLKKKMEITALQLEDMIDRLEKGSGQQVRSTSERLVNRNAWSSVCNPTSDPPAC